jgi:hypothetical protein
MPVSKKPRHKRDLSKTKMLSRQVGAGKYVELLSRAFPVIIRSDEDIQKHHGKAYYVSDVFVAGWPGTAKLILEKGL